LFPTCFVNSHLEKVIIIMPNNKVLCTCYKCKKKENNGCYVSPSTKWRHTKKEKNFSYILNDHETNR